MRAAEVKARSRSRPFGVIGPETLRLRLDDGVELAADLYRPEAPGPFPRPPDAPALRAPDRLDRRPRPSGLVRRPRLRRRDPGRARARRQHGRLSRARRRRWRTARRPSPGPPIFPGGTGQVATYGFSYQAMTQLLALAGAARAGSKTPDAHRAGHGRLERAGRLGLRGRRLPARGQSRLGLPDGRRAGAARRRPRGLHRPGRGGARRALVRRAAGPARGAGAAWSTDSHYASWLADDPATWEAIAPAAALEGLRLAAPGLFVGGWLDGMLEGTLATHAAFRGRRLLPAAPARRPLASPALEHGPRGLGSRPRGGLARRCRDAPLPRLPSEGRAANPAPRCGCSTSA